MRQSKAQQLERPLGMSGGRFRDHRLTKHARKYAKRPLDQRASFFSKKEGDGETLRKGLFFPSFFVDLDKKRSLHSFFRVIKNQNNSLN